MDSTEATKRIVRPVRTLRFTVSSRVSTSVRIGPSAAARIAPVPECAVAASLEHRAGSVATVVVLYGEVAVDEHGQQPVRSGPGDAEPLGRGRDGEGPSTWRMTASRRAWSTLVTPYAGGLFIWLAHGASILQVQNLLFRSGAVSSSRKHHDRTHL